MTDAPIQCVAEVWSAGVFRSYRCSRKAGHGPGLRYCKQHDPDAVKARRDASDAKWKREYAEKKARWKYQEQRTAWIDAYLQAIADIAAGHNDPRKLASDLLSVKPKEPSHD